MDSEIIIMQNKMNEMIEKFNKLLHILKQTHPLRQGFCEMEYAIVDPGDLMSDSCCMQEVDKTEDGIDLLDETMVINWKAKKELKKYMIKDLMLICLEYLKEDEEKDIIDKRRKIINE